MATLESMAIRSNAALDRIEAKMQEWGVKTAPLPRLMKDREMLRCNQLERIADMMDALQKKLDAIDTTASKASKKRNPSKAGSHD